MFKPPCFRHIFLLLLSLRDFLLLRHSESASILFLSVCIYLFVLKIALLSFLCIGYRKREAQFVLRLPSSNWFNALLDSIC